jgi:amino acid adenylation domain-containing protein
MARMILTTHWTGGDVFPFLDIGKALRERGHEVILFTHYFYAEKARWMGLDFVAWDTPEAWAGMEKDFPMALDPINNYQGSLHFHQQHLTNQKYRAEYQIIEPYCHAQENTVIVARHGSSVASLLAAEQYGIPIVSVYMAPSYLNQLSIDEAIFGKMLTANLNALRRELGLPPVLSWTAWICSPKRSLALWPEWFYSPDASWPAGIIPVGFPFGKPDESGLLEEEVQSFLAEGEPPLLISGGTSKGLELNFYWIAVAACRIAGFRALLVTQHPELVPENLPPNFRWFKFLDFEALLPRVKAIIHHGGIGTLSGALRAGIPQLVMAHNVDRPFNAFLLQKLGVGEFFPLARWNPSLIAEGLNRLPSPAIIQKCLAYSVKIRQSDAMTILCQAVEATIENPEFIISKTGSIITTPSEFPATENVSANNNAELPEQQNLTPEKRALLALMVRRNSPAKLETDYIPKIPRTGNDHFPLSFSQERLWFMEQLDPGNPSFNVFAAYHLSGALDRNALEKALYEIVKRHEIWRTTFEIMDDQPVQIIHPDPALNLSIIDLQQLDPNIRQSEIESLIRKEIATPFNLVTGPLWRIKLMALSKQEHILVMVSHHMVNDGTSVGVFLRELGEYYSIFVMNNVYQPPELPIQYADFAVWQREYFQGKKLSDQMTYWQEKLDGEIPVLELPFDHRRPPVKTITGKTQWFELPHPAFAKLRTFGHQTGATRFMVLLATFKALFHRYSGQTDLIIGSPIAGRTRAEIEPLIGCFVNTLIIRTRLDPAMSFRQLVRQVKETSLEAYDHQEIPFEKLVRILNPERSLSHTPIFQVLFNLQHITPFSNNLTGLTIHSIDINRETVQFDLNIAVWEEDWVLKIALQYNVDLFEDATISRMIGHFQTFLDGAIANPDKPIGGLPLLTEAEYQQIVYTWNHTQVIYPETVGVHQLFERHAELVPDKIAVVFENEQLTYRELNRRSNQLAYYLRSMGVGPETKVALYMERSLDIIIGILGILKAGGAYVPLDPIYPSDRIRFILSDVRASVLVTQSALVKGLMDIGAVCVILLDDDWPEISRFKCENPTLTITSSNLMYILFTSGSTGRPKGVAVEHGNYLNYIYGIIPRLDLQPGLSFAIVTTFAADLGTTMLWGALGTGGQLHIISYECAADPLSFRKYCHKHPIDVLKLVPSHFEMLQGQIYSNEILPKQRLIFAGETSNWSMIEKIKSLNPVCRIQNHYGPTETTVAMLTYPVDIDCQHPPTPTVLLGKPLGNTQAYILNEYLQPVPVRVPGELYIGGAGVSRGYLNHPDLTAERFIPDPFSREPGRRLYRAGDRVRYLPDGNIEFLERVDDQVKIRGYRIELGEIESVIQNYPGIQDGIVVAREDTPGDKRLVAYLVIKGNETALFNYGELRDYLRRYLPDYMVPTAFVILDKIPLNANGKVDRNKLPIPDSTAESRDKEYAPPETEIQMKMANIWSEVLGVEKIGIDDNFFNLGGESFKAVRVVRKIDPSLSVIALFKHHTIRELSGFLVQNSGPSNELLYELTKSASSEERTASLVCIPYGGGSAVSFQPLADVLSKNLALFAVQIPGHDYSRPDEPLQPIAEVARRCVQEIKCKIRGPVVVYGHCLGGALALEIVRLLERDRFEVSGLFESGVFPSPRLPGKWFELWSKIFPQDRWMSNLAYRDMLKAFGGLTAEMDDQEQNFLIRSMRHDFREAEDYYTMMYANTPQKLKTPITSIVGAKDRMTEFYQERYHEWDFFSEAVDFQVIPHAGHYFQKHQAPELSRIIAGKVAEWQEKPLTVFETACETPSSVKPAVQTGKNLSSTNRVLQPSIKIFLLVAFGQLISMIGTSLSGFAMGVWIYQKTGAVTDFALIGVFSTLPGILMLPLAGAVADRWDRRKIMILSDALAAIAIIMVALLLWNHSLKIWHIYLTTCIGSIAVALQRPAYLAAITQLVPKRYLGQANGIVQLATATGGMLAPALGGILVLLIGLPCIIIMDFISYLFSIAILLAVSFPDSLFKKREEPILKEIVGGWNYVIKRKSLVVMILFFVVYNFLFSMAGILTTPLVLSFGSPAMLGWVMAASGAGGLIGAILMALWGGTRRRAEGMVGFVMLAGISLVLLGCQPFFWTAILGVLGIWLSMTFINAHWQSLMQVKVGLELQGRVFATNQMMAWSTVPLGFLATGPLVDKIFEPLMAKGQILANIFGWLVGVEHGRGMGLIMVLIGIILTFWGFLGLQYRPLRFMEDILPDAIPDTVILDDKDALQKQADRMIQAVDVRQRLVKAKGEQSG